MITSLIQSVWSSIGGLLSRRFMRFLVIIAVIFTVSFLGVRLFQSSSAATGTWDFGPSGVHGAGFQNVMAMSPFLDPAGKRPLLVGADIAGIHRSLDRALTWQASNRGMNPNNNASEIAAIMWSDATPGKVFICTFDGIYMSTDFGQSWNQKSRGVFCKGNSGGHPRPVGNMMVQDTSGTTDYLYLASWENGVMRSTNDGDTWTVIAPASLVGGRSQIAADNHPLRGLAINPANKNELFVGTHTKGVFRSQNVKAGVPAFSPMAGSPATAEEMEFIDGKMYVAANLGGVRMWNGTAWSALNNGLSINATAEYATVVGYKAAGGNIVLYAGSASSGDGRNLFTSDDGGISWTNITSRGDNYVGTTQRWWLWDFGYQFFDNPAYAVSQLVIDPDDRSDVYFAGRGGAYKLVNGVTPWQPAHRGLMVVVGEDVKPDPKKPGRVYASAGDWTFFLSSDNLQTVRMAREGVGGQGFHLAIDPQTPAAEPSYVYMSTGSDWGATGSPDLTVSVRSNADPGAGPWINENLPAENLHRRIVGLGAGRVGAQRVILVAVDGNGLWRKAGAVWNRIQNVNAPFQSGSGNSPFGGLDAFAWLTGDDVFACDAASGLWRSNDGGLTWAKLMDACASMGIDPSLKSRIYVATAMGVYRINNATTIAPASVSPVQISPITSGSMAVGPDGRVYIKQPTTGVVDAKMSVVSNPTAASGFTTTLISDEYYAGTGGRFGTFAVGPDEHIYMASGENGFSVARPSAAAGDTTAPSTAVTAPVSGAVVQPGTNVTITATATDNVAVTKVEFYNGSTLLGSVPTAPYTFNMALSATAAAGSRTLTVKAYDAAGNIGTSASVLIRVATVTQGNGDANNDARVNAIDLSLVISKDGQNFPAADFNRDGIVGAADLAILLARWTW